MLDPRDRRTIGRWSRPMLVALGALSVTIASTWLFRPLDAPEPEPSPASDVTATASADPAPAPADDREPSATPDEPSAPPDEPSTPAARRRAVFRPTEPAPPPGAVTRAQRDQASVMASPDDAHGEPDVDAGSSPETRDEATIRGIWPTDADGIRSAVREALPDLRECYQGWLQANPELEGTTKASFTITADDDGREGTVTAVHLQESTLNQPFLEGCVLNVLSALRFEAPADGPVTVTYPFVLRGDR